MATTKIRCCYNCVFAYLDREHTVACVEAGLPNWPACANHPDSYGRMQRTPARGICPNYRPRPGRPEGDVRMIPLRDGYYAYVDGARAYDHKAVELGGEFARVNFPEEWPANRPAEVYPPPKDLPSKKRRKSRS